MDIAFDTFSISSRRGLCFSSFPQELKLRPALGLKVVSLTALSGFDPRLPSFLSFYPHELLREFFFPIAPRNVRSQSFLHELAFFSFRKWRVFFAFVFPLPSALMIA